MVRVIMRGCNGRMGRVISGLLAEDREACLVAGIDLVDDGHNPYPVYKDIRDCDVEADCMIDFSSAAAWDDMLDYCVENKLPCVLCTTGLSDAQLEKIEKGVHKPSYENYQRLMQCCVLPICPWGSICS